jgi:hypothetical protein
MERKVCSKCKEEKEVCEFGKCKKSKDGLDYSCKLCKKQSRNSPINKEKIKLRNQNWNSQNKEYFKEYFSKNDSRMYKSKYRDKNKEKIDELSKKYRENNKEKINQQLREWRKLNKEKLKQYYIKSKDSKKRYIEKNSDKVRERRNKYFRLRKNNDTLFKLSSNIRTLINNSLKNKGYSKNTKSYKILGVNFKELLTHFENLFEDWMSWDNHGKYNGEFNYGWDIDHIIPLSSAKDEEDIIKLNHYTNLQPLCSKINREIKRGLITN